MKGDKTPILRIAEAVSTTACDGATVIEPSGEEPRKIRCKKFEAELYDPVNVDEDTEELTATGETVTVRHKFSEPMTVGETLTLALRADGRWTILVWECEDG